MTECRDRPSIAGRAAGRPFTAAPAGLDDLAARLVRIRRLGLGLLLGTLLAACAGSPPPLPTAMWDMPGGVWDAPTARWGP